MKVVHMKILLILILQIKVKNILLFSVYKDHIDLLDIAVRLLVPPFLKTSSISLQEVQIELSNCGAFDWMSFSRLLNVILRLSGMYIITLQDCIFWVEVQMVLWFFGKLIAPNLKEYFLIQEISIKFSLLKILTLLFLEEKMVY